MNCQIIEIESHNLSFEIISSRIDIGFKLGTVVEIERAEYLDTLDTKLTKDQAKSFGKIVQISSRIIKLKLFRPELFKLGKIIKLNPIKEEIFFLPHILNRVMILGDKFELDLEQSFEFIPTALVGEQVLQGQKIGYINTKTSFKQNFKYWILSSQSGKISKVELGDFKIGQQIAIIDKSNVLLGNQKKDIRNNTSLLEANFEPKTIDIGTNNKDELKIITGRSNLVVDVSKKFLSPMFLLENLDNYILIFVTQDQNFVANSSYKSITFLDKYNLGQAISSSIFNFALNICELGYSVIIISQNPMFLGRIGQYKTINGEDVSITYVFQDCYRYGNKNHYDNVIVVD